MDKNIGELFFVLAFLVLLSVFVIYWYLFIPVGLAYAGYRIYLNSPGRKEKHAKDACNQLYERALELIGDEKPFHDQVIEFGGPIVRSLPESLPEALYDEMVQVVIDLFELENLVITRVAKPPAICNSLEGARYRDHLSDLIAKHNDIEANRQLAQRVIKRSFHDFLMQLPTFDGEEGDIVAEVPLSQTCDLRPAIADLYISFYLEDVRNTSCFRHLREVLNRNMCEASGLEPTATNARTEAISVTEYEGEDPAYAYLKHTPLLRICEAQIPYRVPQKLRFEHQWIIAPTGSGKTNLLSTQLDRDFDLVAKDQASVIVMESKRDLIKGIEGLDRFGPGGDLEGKLVLIDVEDNQYPAALNLFDLLARDATEELSFRDEEILKNSTQSMLEYVFRSLLDAKLTSMQSTLLRFSIELMLQVPGATLEDLTVLLEQPGGEASYRSHLSRMSGDGRRFFESKFNDPAYKRTKGEVLNRIYAVKSIGTLSRMFAAPNTKLNMYEEMGSAKVILINTCKALMQQEGAELFGRFMIALTLLAAEKRQLQPRSERLPTFFYIDECQDYIRSDEMLPVILAQARALNLGMVLAHQNLSQISSDVQGALISNTSIKYASHVTEGVSSLAQAMRTDSRFIVEQPKYGFAAYFRDVTNQAISIKVPETDFEKHPRMSEEDHRSMIENMREAYCYRIDWKGEAPSPESGLDEPSSEDDGGIDGDWER